MAIQAAKAQTADYIINNLLVTMGLKVDEAVNQAIAALLHANSHVVAGVLESSVAIQELELTLDQAVFSALEKGDLCASEIKRVRSAVNISKDLSRLGKLAANLGRKVTEVGKHQEHEDFSRLQPLAIAVSHLCRQTLRSVTRLDPVLARNAAEGGASVDAYRDYVLRGLNAQINATDEQSLHLIFASRCLEQIADNAVHLAENLLVFLADHREPENSHTMAS
ncbi:MAG TPA: PhoU domain-containing protein [Candidatus Angelobacter sp.]|jgi:phosphate transport system protein|nr:PhoU domain-containing protein [Candidatus Angelobacter sp.]